MMDVQLLVLSAAVATTIVVGAVAVLLLLHSRKRRSLQNRLQNLTVQASEEDGVRSTILRDVESQNRLGSVLLKLPYMRRLDLLLTQAGASRTLGSFVTLVGCLALLAGGGVYALWRHEIVAPIVVGLVAAIPVMGLVRRKRVRVAQFERNFPDALDMLTSALRAGLAFSGAIQVVADEAPEAVAKEFRILAEEHRLGLDLREALIKLSQRIDSTELRLFVTAVILQRETGGNLTEILERTAAVIRDRFRILGDVRTMTAQARLSGLILSALPIVLAGVIFVLAPDYLKVLRDDPAGPYLVATALTLQVVGYAIMNRIISIKV